MAEEHVEDNPGEEGPVPVLRWDLCLFEQIVRSFRFPPEWEQIAHLYQAAFSTFGGSMGVRPLQDGEEYWHEQIRGNFMYPAVDAFAELPTATEGVLRNLGIDPEDKKKKPVKKKKVITLDPEVTSKGAGGSRATSTAADKDTLRRRQSNLEDYVIISDSFEGLSRISEKKTGAGGSKSSGSAGSRNPDAGTTPPSVAQEEDDEEEAQEEPAVKLIRKRSREAALGAAVLPKPGDAPLIGKKKAEKKKPEKGITITEPLEPAQKRPRATKVTIKPFPASKSADKEKQKGPEKPVREKEVEQKKTSDKPLTGPKEPKITAPVTTDTAQGSGPIPVTGPEQPIAEKGKNLGVENLIEPSPTTAPVQTGPVTTEQATAAAGGSAGFAAGQAGAGSWGGARHSPIGPMDTLGDVYYKSYTEESRGEVLHQPPWSLKQKDTFLEFAPCRDWLLNSIPPGEVNRQRERTHSALYHAYVVGEANTRAANHQIVREWRTMVREREEWEKYRERLLKQVKAFERSKAAFDEERAKLETDKKAEEWGREGLKNKLRAAEELLSKERAEWKAICVKDNERMYAARSKITELEGQVADLKKKAEDAQAEFKAQISSKDRDLSAKDVEITELKRRLREHIERSESLEIDLEAEKSKAATAEEAKQKAEEARAISTTALNVVQNNYSEAQSIVDTLVAEAEWLRSRGIALMANSVLNAGELDTAVAALIDASRAVGHRGGYLECAQHVSEMFGQEFDTSHCSVTDQAEAKLARAENGYDNLSLPVMDLVTEALKHDDWCHRLKTILDPPQMVELSDEEGLAVNDEGDDDGGDGDQPE
ncbi:uncharacterized protein LOC110869593 [Helianthus annuus]|uniref:uncharacterized protein LOC110869593 n=1 Tax=Helianthus annuus TaxID=4232 RepID=UPI000B8F7B9D|nr:uncharacterized protein LOC110869593 [Helianthus annuus]